MKRYNEPLDDQLIDLNDQFKLSEDESNELLVSINERMDESGRSKQGFFNKALAFTLTGVAAALFLLMIPMLMTPSENTGEQESTLNNLSVQELTDKIKNESITDVIDQQDYTTVHNYENKTLQRYDIGASESYEFNDPAQIIDVDALKSENLTAQLFVEQDNGEVLRYYAYYLNEQGDLTIYMSDDEEYEGQVDETLFGEDRASQLRAKLKQDIEIGMSKQEVLAILGPYSFIFSHGATESELDYQYNYLRYDVGDNTYTPLTNFVDFPAIVNEKLDMQMFIQLNDNQVEAFSAIYTKDLDENIYQYHMTEEIREHDKGDLTEGIFDRTGGETPQHIKTGDFMNRIPSVDQMLSQFEAYDTNQSITVEELWAQHIDKQFNEPITTIRHFKPGDTIYVEDQIDQVGYDEELDLTHLIFEGDHEESIVFKGDLTDEYVKGDTIKLKFKVLALSADGVFSRINYQLYTSKFDEPPTIDQYLVE
ncbi:hypothetical protein [Aquisalibacillus elongatus]|uniref:Uncharacterized protein n=1 Tax=Aquisalibacillus elongatus TaxID=485577 RepID=A0A3N5BU18_9BACI|nr:hypothetical protein [Aquisalibacillus elongatus]RPF53278.1 hypothetical protein EDC24_1775 [Aquisalibacillus elongatus]